MSVQFSVPRKSSLRRAALLALAVLLFRVAAARAQEQPAAPAPSASLDERLRALQDQLLQLQSAMNSMHDEIRSHAESAELRREMETTRLLLAAQVKATGAVIQNAVPGSQPESSTLASMSAASTGPSSQTPEETLQLTNAKLQELHQTKVESASKYPVRLTGIVLLNVAENRGAVDNLDFPSLCSPQPARVAAGSFGATAAIAARSGNFWPANLRRSCQRGCAV